MLAAISTTILSSRSWAETCSAMVSRSRLNRTRGPPDALRITEISPPKNRAGALPRDDAKLRKNNNSSHSAPPCGSSPPHSALYRIEACFAKQKACQANAVRQVVMLRQLTGDLF